MLTECYFYIISNLDTIEESGSILSPSDISYDKTEEDFDTPRRPSRCKRPSAPPLDNEDDLTPPGKKSRRAAVSSVYFCPCTLRNLLYDV